ncbi:MAG TPA: hypothetical protein PK447_04415 [Ignavibacteria bacterium]|nr:hypothetical protein [Ignavibacteria bacterium]
MAGKIYACCFDNAAKIKNRKLKIKFTGLFRIMNLDTNKNASTKKRFNNTTFFEEIHNILLHDTGLRDKARIKPEIKFLWILIPYILQMLIKRKYNDIKNPI